MRGISPVWKRFAAVAVILMLIVLPRLAWGETRAASDAIAQAEASGDCAPGQALVIYHASGASKGSTGSLSVQSDADPLAEAGFFASGTWNLSAADETLSAQSDDARSSAASGSDVRVALVERDDLSVADLVSQLEALDFVECASPNYVYATCSLTDDPLSDLQWNLWDTAGVNEEAALSAETASTSGNVVAVLDTGVDYTNPDLAKVMWTDTGRLGLGSAGSHGYNAYDNTDDPMPGSSAKHGTHVAGIVAAQTSNKEGVASIAGSGSHTQIMGLRVTDDEGGYFFDTDVAACYQYLVKAKLAGVGLVAVNNSWGEESSHYDAVLDYLVNQAGKAGVISVFSAGNSGIEASSDNKVALLESPYAIVVAASNESGGLASFSDYHSTAVDVAAPGAKILSTVPVGYLQFDALLSHLNGKDASSGMAYYTDIAGVYDGTSGGGESGFAVELTDSSGTRLPEECQDDFSLSASTQGEAPVPAGQRSIQVTLDADKFADDSYAASEVLVSVSWKVPNPFKGMTGLVPYAYNVDATIAGLNQTSSQQFGVYESLLAPDGTDLVAPFSADYCKRDSCGSVPFGGAGWLTSYDTASDTLTARVAVSFYSGVTSGTVSCLVTGYGVGDVTKAGVPYAYESGTSMAAPAVTGAVAELATLSPNSTALQLRGMVCGGTVPLATTDDQAKVASGGRFSFEAALDPASVCPSTWSITTSGSQVTVHGYALDGVTLTVDGASVSPASQSAGSITFDGSSILDGAAHRIDVSKAVGGVERTYKASYVTPDASASSLTRVHDLPDVISASTARLVSSTDRLFCADGSGSYLYSCATPSDPTSAWSALAAPGTPWGEAKPSLNRLPMSFAYRDGRLYAFAIDDVAATEITPEQAVLYCSTYDVASNSWKGFEEIGRVTSDEAVGLSASFVGDTACCYLSTKVNGAVRSYVLERAGGQTSFSAHDVGTAETTFSVPYAMWSVSGKLCGVGYAKDGSGSCQPVLVSCDPSSGTLANEGTLAGYGSTSVSTTADSLLAKVQAAVGNGLVVAGDSSFGLGDLQLVNTSSASATELGSFGLSSASGLTVGSSAMFAGRLYFTATDHVQTSAGDEGSKNPVGLYGLPDDPAAALASTDVTVSAAAAAGGTAAVADWRAQAGESLDVRYGDAATWTATASAGYSFDGWYDASGKLVSSSSTYTADITAPVALAARFSATSPTSPAASAATPAAAATASQADEAATAMPVPQTSDPASSVAAVASVVAATVLLGLGAFMGGRG